jgi:hypothetical protein
VLSSNFYFWLIIFIFFYIYSEFLFSLVINNVFKNIKFFNIESTKNYSNIIFKNNSYLLILNFLFLFLVTLKINNSNILFSFIIIYILINKYINVFF